MLADLGDKVLSECRQMRVVGLNSPGGPRIIAHVRKESIDQFVTLFCRQGTLDRYMAMLAIEDRAFMEVQVVIQKDGIVEKIDVVRGARRDVGRGRDASDRVPEPD